MTRISLLTLISLLQVILLRAQIPPEYKGKPYHDSLHIRGPQQVPGRVELALYDLGGKVVDISFTKDWADFNHPGKVDPPVIQLYIGWQSDGEWTNYTIQVNKPGRYRIITIYGYQDNNL